MSLRVSDASVVAPSVRGSSAKARWSPKCGAWNSFDFLDDEARGCGIDEKSNQT